LVPFFGETELTKITPGMVQDYSRSRHRRAISGAARPLDWPNRC